MKRTIALLISLILILSLLSACGSGSSGKEIAVEVPGSIPAVEDNARVFYEIFVGSFSDSDGDGIGDLRGIINRMDYLNDGDPESGKSLGVEGLWLTPIFESRSYHKYDVVDYYSVDKTFGTTEDLKELVELCHERDVKVILDLPINHTARGCEWFNRFIAAHRAGETDDPYYDYYCYYTQGEDRPAGRTFEELSGTDDFYECNFDDGMPELNFDNQDVRQAVLDVAKYYLDLGIDGFRFDAAKYIYFGDNGSSVEFWTWYLDQLRNLKPDIYTIAEVWDADGVTDLYYPAVNCFNFSVSQAEGFLAKAAQTGDVGRYVSYVDTYLDAIAGSNPDAMYVPFIANHDTDRAAGYLPVTNGRAQMAANLLLLGPGSPFLYYGEELGLKGSRGSANTDANRRLAMPWGDEDTVKDPEGTTYDKDNRVSATAAEQIANRDSLYNYYKKVILLRKANPEIARGDITALKFGSSKAAGFLAAWEGSKCCVLHNTTDSAVTLDLSQAGLSELKEISGFVGLGQAVLEGTTLTLDAQTSVVLR